MQGGGELIILVNLLKNKLDNKMGKQVIDKADYIVKQISKTNKKNYENYVVTGIIHSIRSLNIDLEFKTQQFVEKKNGGYYITDLYFPQLKLHIEVDEEHHITNQINDKLRSIDIINVSDCKIERIEFYKRDENEEIIEKKVNLKEVDKRIKEVVAIIKQRGKEFENNDWFSRYINPKKYYEEKGVLDRKDNPTFRIAAQIANLLGQNYKDNAQKLWVANLKKYDGYSMWCPKIYNPHEDWTNTFCQTEGEDILIQQNNKEGEEKKKQFEKQINNKFSNFKRITFPYLKDNLGVYGYKFRGIYELDKENSSVERGIIYKRIEREFIIKN